MIVSELYSGSGLGNQLWNLVVPRILAKKNGYEWGVKKSNPFKACAFMTNFDFGKEVVGGCESSHQRVHPNVRLSWHTHGHVSARPQAEVGTVNRTL